MSWVESCISVDIEAAGPHPSRFALLSIGACRVTDLADTFYIELRPDRGDVDPRAMEVSGLSFSMLDKHGTPPGEAMQAFADWISNRIPSRPIFVAFNAPFDWMYVNDYFHRYLGHNPFGYSALDIKALYLGSFGGNWAETNMRSVSRGLNLKIDLKHHALQDAQDQAKLFLQILKGQPR